MTRLDLLRIPSVKQWFDKKALASVQTAEYYLQNLWTYWSRTQLAPSIDEWLSAVKAQQ